MDLPNIFVADNMFEVWINYFFNIIKFDVPEELKTPTKNPEEADILSKNLYWKIKIISMNILFLVYRK